jgi:hypothetical protein
LALYSGWLCAHRIRRVIAPISGQRVLLARPVGAQLLRTASLTEAALALGVGAIARSARTGRGYDLVDECGAVLVARNNPNDSGD